MEGVLEPEMLDRVLEALEPSPVELRFPKFEMETSLELGDDLRNLGLDHAFDPGHADFSGISGDPEGLVLSEVVHQARIRVDEKGTEAVATTAAGWVRVGTEEEALEPVSFVVNRPFFFLIREEVTGAILFLGRVLNPVD